MWEFRALLALILLVVSALLAVNLGFREPKPSDPASQIDYGEQRNIPAWSYSGYASLLAGDSLNPDLHYGLIRSSADFLPDSPSIQNIYQRWMYYPDSAHRDMGALGLGMSNLTAGHELLAIFYLSQVRNEQLKYLNYSLGSTYLRRGNHEKAERYLTKELSLPGGHLAGACEELIRLYREQDNDSALVALMQDERLLAYFPQRLVQELSLKSGDLQSYFKALLIHISKRVTLQGFLAALLVLAIWLVYLLRLDIFDKRGNAWAVPPTLVAGMAMSLGAFLLSDLYRLSLQPTMGDWGAFVNAVVGVGAAEELVKIFPLLVILALTRIVREPYDYLLHASVSALGFAFVENLLYYDGTSPNIIHSRAMTAVVGHMFNSSLVAYGLVISRYRYPRLPAWLAFIASFSLAALSHGLYNHLINTDNQTIFILFFFFTTMVWTRMLNNSLNNSPSFTYDRKLKAGWIQFYLVIALTAVLIFEYLIIGWMLGPEVANQSLRQASIGGSFLIIFLAISLSHFELEHKRWKPVASRDMLVLDSSAWQWGRRPAPLGIGSRVVLSAYHYNNVLNAHLETPVEAEVSRILWLNGASPGAHWMYIRLSRPLEISPDILSAHLLIRFRDNSPQLGAQDGDLVYVRDAFQTQLPEQKVFDEATFPFLGMAYVKLLQPTLQHKEA